MKTKKVDHNVAYRKAVAKMESEVKRAVANVTLLKMLYKEIKQQGRG